MNNPDNANNHNDKANLLVKMGLNNEAIKEYEIAIKLDPEIAGYYYNKGIAMQNLKNYVGAIIAYENAIALDPKDPNFHYNRATALDSIKRWDDAIKEYDEVIKLDPQKSYYYGNKGLDLADIQRYSEAVNEFNNAIKLEPENPYYHYSKARMDIIKIHCLVLQQILHRSIDHPFHSRNLDHP